MRMIGSGVTGFGQALGRRMAGALLALGAAALSGTRAAGIGQDKGPQEGATGFIVYYGQAGHAALRDCRVLVLDADVDAALLRDRAPGSTALGYVSLGEVHAGRRYFAEVEAAGLLIAPHPNWPDAWFVDLRADGWHRLVLDRILPDCLARGFDGVFLDTLDDAEHLETTDPARFSGMVAAAAGLLRGMRRRRHGLPIMVNRGYAVLPHAVGRFDMLLGESVRATHDASRNAYALLSDQDYAWQRDRMWAARDRDPSLRLFSLDYWDPEDRAGIARLYAEQRRNGFTPYVATPDLTRIVPEPPEHAP